MSIARDGTGGFEQRLLDRLTEMDAARPATAATKPTAPNPVAATAAPNPAPNPAHTAGAAPKPAAPAGSGPPRRRWSRPVVVGVAALAALAAGATATAAALLAGPRDLQSAGTDVHPGGPLYLKGSGCPDGARVAIAWDGAALADTVARPGDLFSADVTVPPDAALGTHEVTAACGPDTVLRLRVTVLRAHPPAPLPPDFAIGGVAMAHGQFVVKGAGCRAGTTVTFTADGLTPQSSTADAGGTYTAVLDAGTLAIGDHEIAAACAGWDGARLVRTATLTVVAPETATATAKPTG